MRTIGVSTACLIVCAGSVQSGGQSPSQPAPWTLTDGEIREILGRVGAGRDLTPKSWPDCARVAVGLSFDLDNETGALRDLGRSPALQSQGEYGSRAGLPRVLAMLDRHGIAASFFVPALSAMLHQDSMEAIAQSCRHEVGLHGWIHERNSQLDQDEGPRTRDPGTEGPGTRDPGTTGPRDQGPGTRDKKARPIVR